MISLTLFNKKENVMKNDSREVILEQIYQRLEKEYDYDRKELHLNTLQEIMIQLNAVDEYAEIEFNNGHKPLFDPRFYRG